jgi:hypothetical protein
MTWAVHIANRRGAFDTEAMRKRICLSSSECFHVLARKRPWQGSSKWGTPFIYEVDDLLMEMPHNNPNHEFAMQCRPFVLDVMKKAAAITVSTEALKAELLRWNPNIYVLPNLIDERLWSQAQRPHAGPVVIGFTGTSTHGDDLRMIEDAFVQISAKHGQGVAFQFMGCVTDRLARLPGAKVAEFTPDYESFARALQTTPMDIAVVSLEDNLFNRCKSNIKWLEYSACGIAGVYSDLHLITVASGTDKPGCWLETVFRIGFKLSTPWSPMLRCAVPSRKRPGRRFSRTTPWLHPECGFMQRPITRF